MKHQGRFVVRRRRGNRGVEAATATPVDWYFAKAFIYCIGVREEQPLAGLRERNCDR